MTARQFCDSGQLGAAVDAAKQNAAVLKHRAAAAALGTADDLCIATNDIAAGPPLETEKRLGPASLLPLPQAAGAWCEKVPRQRQSRAERLDQRFVSRRRTARCSLGRATCCGSAML